MNENAISMESAIEFLPEGNIVHTYRQSGPMIIGCDHDKAGLIEDIQKAEEILITGEHAQNMRHGLVIHDDNGPLFIETKTRTDGEKNA